MAVASVTSSAGFQAGNARQAAESQQAQQAQQDRAEELKKQRKEEASKPVVNAQGHTTGTLINVTA